MPSPLGPAETVLQIPVTMHACNTRSRYFVATPVSHGFRDVDNVTRPAQMLGVQYMLGGKFISCCIAVLSIHSQILMTGSSDDAALDINICAMSGSLKVLEHVDVEFFHGAQDNDQ